MKLLYFGRLDHEKGIQAIIQAIDYFSTKQDKKSTHNSSYSSQATKKSKTKQLPFSLYIFGTGNYQSTIKHLAQQYPNHIHYYGFQTLNKIKNIGQQCDYCLMPSLFLETFGLSALNACSRWLPVIAYAKGGCTPFILPDYDLSKYIWSPSEQLIKLLSQLQKSDPAYKKNRQKVQDISTNYSKEKRLTKISSLLPTKTKKILIISDFVQKLGGIETYIYDIKQILESAGYEVKLIGSKMGKSKKSRLLSMLISVCNIPFALYLRHTITNYQPDLIRYHSILRHIGRLPLRYNQKTKNTKRIMYHDLGYFHPFPSSVQSTQQINIKLSRNKFTKGYNPIHSIFITGKRIILQLLRPQIAKLDLHLTPSDFIGPYLHTHYNINQTHIVTLPHFTQQ
jgi:glycosyltransferase involved in cell wall biosynthesis